MKKYRRTRRFWIIGLGALGLAAALLLLPYFIPLSQASQTLQGLKQMPFSNSEVIDIACNSFHYRMYPALADSVKGKVLLVHGLGGSTFSYEESAPQLARDGWLILSVDLPGFGYSSRNPNYNHDQANRALDLWTLLDGVDSRLSPQLAQMPWFLAGHSMGGGTVAAMAIKDEARTAGLILIDPALSEAGGGSILTQFPPAVRLMQVALERFLLSEAGVRRFLTSAYGRAPTPEEISGYLAPLTLPGTARMAKNLFKSADVPDAALLSKTSLPILAIWGSLDTWVPPDESQKLLDIRPDAEIYIIEGAAHCPMETHTQEFVSTVLDWLNEQT